MKAIGICFGATTMQCVELTCSSGTGGAGVLAEHAVRIPHEGDPRRTFLDYLQSQSCRSAADRVAVTGRAFRNCVALTSISEPEAVERALRGVYGGSRQPDAVISSGGETQLVYTVNSSGGIGSALSGNKCASGTGEFFLQQIKMVKAGSAHQNHQPVLLQLLEVIQHGRSFNGQFDAVVDKHQAP